MISLETALERIAASIQPLPAESTPIPTHTALGRIAAEPVTARIDLPAFDNSAMDGYAVRSSDLTRATASHAVELRVLTRTAAGSAAAQPVTAGGCIRVFTGSVLPEGADAVVMQEDTRPVPPCHEPAVTDRRYSATADDRHAEAVAALCERRPQSPIVTPEQVHQESATTHESGPIPLAGSTGGTSAASPLDHAPSHAPGGLVSLGPPERRPHRFMATEQFKKEQGASEEPAEAVDKQRLLGNATPLAEPSSQADEPSAGA